MMNWEEHFKSVEGVRQAEKDKNLIPYIFHVHLDHQIHWRAGVLDDTHPPSFCIGEEGRQQCNS